MRITDNIFVIMSPYYFGSEYSESLSLIVHKGIMRLGYLLFLVMYLTTAGHWMSFVARVDPSVDWVAKRIIKPAGFILTVILVIIYICYYVLLCIKTGHEDAYYAVDGIMLYFIAFCFLLCAILLTATSLVLYLTVKRNMAIRILPYAVRTLALSIIVSILLIVRVAVTVIWLAPDDSSYSEKPWPLYVMILLQVVEFLPLIAMLFLMWPSEVRKQTSYNNPSVQIYTYIPDTEIGFKKSSDSDSFDPLIPKHRFFQDPTQYDANFDEETSSFSFSASGSGYSSFSDTREDTL